MDQPWAKKAVRIAIAIGDDADEDVFGKIHRSAGDQAMRAHNPTDLVKFIKWASTAVLKAASAPATQMTPGSTQGTNVPIPTAPEATTDQEDVW